MDDAETGPGPREPEEPGATGETAGATGDPGARKPSEAASPAVDAAPVDDGTPKPEPESGPEPEKDAKSERALAAVPAPEATAGGKSPEKKATGRKATGEKPAGEKPAGEKPAGKKAAGEKAAGEGDRPKRGRVINPWLATAAATLVVLACGAAIQSPFSMVTAHRVPTSDLPRLSDPAPADGTSVSGGIPAHMETPPVTPAAVVEAVTQSGTPSATSSTAPGTPGASGVRGTNAVGTGGIPQTVLLAYQTSASNLARMAPDCKLPWSLLAGVGRVESEHANGGNVTADGTAVTPILGPRLDGGGGFMRIPDTDDGRYDFDKELDRAVGPMQFIPSTWRSWAMDGNRDGRADPQNVFDATLAAGRYLCAGGRDLSTEAGLDKALFSYNRSTEYGRTVKSWMRYYETGVKTVPDAVKPPSKTPSNTPSKTPSKTPSETPSKTPSETPSKTPSSTPSKTPSKTPTKTPSTTPPTTSGPSDGTVSQSPGRTTSQSPARSTAGSPDASGSARAAG